MFPEKFWIFMVSFITKKKEEDWNHPLSWNRELFWINQMYPILLNEPIYIRVGYIFDLRFSEWKI